MSTQTIVITGASDGVGAAAARQLAARGEQVVLVGRSEAKTKAVADQLGAAYYLADFADLAQVRDLAAKLLADLDRIDVLANNAGGIMAQRTLTVDGYERTLQVNHLAPFLLTNLLMPALTAGGAKLLQTSSIGARLFGHLDLDDVQSEKGFVARKAYGSAKLANILFTRELHRRYRSEGVSAVAFHPGNVASNFGATATGLLGLVYNTPLKYLALISPERAADELVWLAEGTPDTTWQSGEYYEKHRVAATHPQAGDPVLAARLWDISADMVGI